MDCRHHVVSSIEFMLLLWIERCVIDECEPVLISYVRTISLFYKIVEFSPLFLSLSRSVAVAIDCSFVFLSEKVFLFWKKGEKIKPMKLNTNKKTWQLQKFWNSFPLSLFKCRFTHNITHSLKWVFKNFPRLSLLTSIINYYSINW